MQQCRPLTLYSSTPYNSPFFFLRHSFPNRKEQRFESKKGKFFQKPRRFKLAGRRRGLPAALSRPHLVVREASGRSRRCLVAPRASHNQRTSHMPVPFSFAARAEVLRAQNFVPSFIYDASPAPATVAPANVGASGSVAVATISGESASGPQITTATPARKKQCKRRVRTAVKPAPVRLAKQLCVRGDGRDGDAETYKFQGKVFRALLVNKHRDVVVLGRLCGALDRVEGGIAAQFLAVPFCRARPANVRLFALPAGAQPCAGGKRLSYPTLHASGSSWHRDVEFHRASGRVDSGHQILGGPLGGWVVNTPLLQVLEHSVTWVDTASNGFVFSLHDDPLRQATCGKSTVQQDAACSCSYAARSGVTKARPLSFVRDLCVHAGSRRRHGPKLFASLRGKRCLFGALQSRVRAAAAIPPKELALARLLAGYGPTVAGDDDAVARPPALLLCNGQDLDPAVHAAWDSALGCRCGLRLAGGEPLPGPGEPMGEFGWDERPGADGCYHQRKLSKNRVLAPSTNAAKGQSKRKRAHAANSAGQ